MSKIDAAMLERVRRDADIIEVSIWKEDRDRANRIRALLDAWEEQRRKILYLESFDDGKLICLHCDKPVPECMCDGHGGEREIDGKGGGPSAKQSGQQTRSGSAPNPPCQDCGGPHPFDTTIPSPLWNRVIRSAGLGDYLCITCIVKAFALAGEGFTATLWSDDFNGTPVTFQPDPPSVEAEEGLVGELRDALAHDGEEWWLNHKQLARRAAAEIERVRESYAGLCDVEANLREEKELFEAAHAGAARRAEQAEARANEYEKKGVRLLQQLARIQSLIEGHDDLGEDSPQAEMVRGVLREREELRREVHQLKELYGNATLMLKSENVGQEQLYAGLVEIESLAYEARQGPQGDRNLFDALLAVQEHAADARALAKGGE